MRFCFRISLVLVFGLLLSTCKKDHRMLEASVLPEDDLLTSHYDESAVLYGYAQNAVPVISLNDRYKFLGSNKDEIFGQIDVGLYFNINTTLSNITFTSSPVLDSAVFVFAVDRNTYSGDFSSPLTFSVFPLDSSLSNSTHYQTNKTGLHNPVVFPTMPTTPVVSTNGAHVWRIRLDQAYANEIFSHPERLTGNAELQKHYKGFYLAASAQAGSKGLITRCDLEDGNSGLIFYMRAKVTDSVTITQKFDFSGSAAVRFNTVKQDLTSAYPLLKTQTENDSATTPYFFVKGLGITNTKILIPKLTSFADSANFAVNRAEITFYVDNTLSSKTSTIGPPALCLLPLTPNGRDTFAVDQLATIDNSRYGGVHVAGKYTFNITRHVQAIVDGKVKNNGFVLVVANPERLDLLNTDAILTRIIRRDYYSEGAVLSGPAAPENAPRLKLSFVRLNTK